MERKKKHPLKDMRAALDNRGRALKKTWDTRKQKLREEIIAKKRSYAIGMLSFLLVCFILMSIFFVLFYQEIFSWIVEFQVYSGFMFFLLCVLEIVVAPIPGSIIGLTIASLYHPIIAFHIIYLGGLVGAVLAYSIASFLGKNYIEVLVHPKRLARVQQFIESYAHWLPFLFSLPIFPIAITCFVCGIVQIKFHLYIRAVVIGFFFYTLLIIGIGTLLSDFIMQWLEVVGTLFFLVIISVLSWQCIRLLRSKA